MSDERRRHERRPASIECLWTPTTWPSPSYITNIAPGGCFVETKNVPLVGEVIQITTIQGGTSLRFRGRVVYARQEMGFALEFEDMDPATQERLISLLSTSV